MRKRIKFRRIGLIRTPYVSTAPYQPVDDEEGDFRIVLNRKYAAGLAGLEGFRYIYVIYHIDRLTRQLAMMVNPPWTGGGKVGVFASRSPVRPNPIGISVVRIKQIIDNEIAISGIDVFDNTPLLDIKPYVKDLDSKDDANYGWIGDVAGDDEHLLLHIKGIPHDY